MTETLAHEYSSISRQPERMNTHLRVLNESYLMNTNMTGFRRFSKIFASYALNESSLSIGSVKAGPNSQLLTTC